MCYLYQLEGTYRNYRYLRCHHLQKIHVLRKRGHLLFLRGRVGLRSISPVLEAFWAGQPEMWLPAPSVSLPILLPITRFRFPKGIDLSLLNRAIRICIGLQFLPLLAVAAPAAGALPLGVDYTVRFRCAFLCPTNRLTQRLARQCCMPLCRCATAQRAQCADGNTGNRMASRRGSFWIS
jgi:hypothetical protein